MISQFSLNSILRKKHNRINTFINSIENYRKSGIKNGHPIKSYTPYSPLKPTDICLEKYLKLKKDFLNSGNSEKVCNSRNIFQINC